MEEIKGNKRDLYVREAHVCVRRERVSGENGEERAKEMEGRVKRGREQNHRKMDQLSRTRRNDVVR